MVSGLNADMRQDTRKHLPHNSRLGWGRDGVEVVLGQYNSTLKMYSPIGVARNGQCSLINLELIYVGTFDLRS